MPSIIYSKLSGENDAVFGKFIHPIKALITSESDILSKRSDSIVKKLYNVEKSNKYSETIMGQTDFDTFVYAPEGQRGENDNFALAHKKTIEHIPFMKEFTMTREMAEDSRTGLSVNVKNQAKRFIRAYYKTTEMCAAWALINGTKTSGTFNKAVVDLTAPDGLPLFHKGHVYFQDKLKKETQSNRFYANILSGTKIDRGALESALNVTSNKIRNFKDENGVAMNYIADTIILPCNRPNFEAAVKAVCGSERTTGTNYNDINVQYGNWSIVVLPHWETDSDQMMIMSSDANKSLMGNMFFNRANLDIKADVDFHTRNLMWNGYCRFGIGFAAWKHIALCDFTTGTVADATQLILE